MTRRRKIALLVIAALILVLALLLRWLLSPAVLTSAILEAAGKSLGLEITAGGVGEYRLRGTPMLVVRDVIAREPGASMPLLRARRISLSLPWSTLRAGGKDLVVQRIELDAPQFDLPALQHWLATRPPSEARVPTLTDGLRIRQGTIINDDWRIEGLDADLPSLHPDRLAHARLRGRYLDPPLMIPVDLAVALARPSLLAKGQATGFATHGHITIERGDWSLPASVALSGPLVLGKDELRITPARLGLAARYESGDTRLPFMLGLHGPLKFDEATWTLTPVGVALRGLGDDAPIPRLDASGTLALGRRLVLQLDGHIAQWPAAWPALPSPIGRSSSALPFKLSYLGSPDFAGTAALELQRDATHFQGRFRLPAVLEWIDAGGKGSPLPPLAGTLATPELEISGATLEGVEVRIEDPEIPATTSSR